MKRYLLLLLAAIPLFAYSATFVYCDYDDDDYDGWCDEYWGPDPEYYCDGYWIYYPHGYYCVYYVWYHPWWWDWYWWHCHWCHHFDWHFFRAGFYVVWYEDGCWWWRPRYGRVVRYKLPYAYSEFRYKARSYGVDLPDKPPRQVNVPYDEKEIQRLTREKDPDLYARIEKEHKSGNLERMKKEYETKVRKEIVAKNEEYRKATIKNPADEKYRTERDESNRTIQRKTDETYNQRKSEDSDTRIIRRTKETSSDQNTRTIRRTDGKYYDTDDTNDEEGDDYIRKNTISPRKSESPESKEEYERPNNRKTPIRNLPPPEREEEKRTVRNPSTKNSRR
ncbi:MAG: hypothetical protein ABIL22_05260 [candidate division WOR-3 bacterium]